MDGWGIDGEEYIAAVRAGAVDPHGKTASELQDELDAFDADWSARLAALTEAELDEVVAGRREVPPLAPPVESPVIAALRAETAFAGRVKSLHAQRARLEAEERELMAARFQAMLDDRGDSAMALKETASILAVERATALRRAPGGAWGGGAQKERSAEERALAARGTLVLPSRAADALTGQAVVLVDDVITSGATGREGLRALRSAGCEPVALVALARTPKLIVDPSARPLPWG
ncbi:ComF family protein [Agrococcus beijingensis]|uniref:ComF family protein n=1 Tax=Agrococcus beijingensis TaxID=3068634 RepID=UPI002740E453|nr:phosphoribosyltransferase family protein [Agrococcus sp. REN33]